MNGGCVMVATKNDICAYVNCISDTDLSALCEIINKFQERKNAEAEYFRQMKIAEDSIQMEGTVTGSELRASLGI